MERGEIHGSLLHKKKLLSSHGVLSTMFISALRRKYSQLQQGYVKPGNREPASLKEENGGEAFKSETRSCCSLCGKWYRKGLKMEQNLHE